MTVEPPHGQYMGQYVAELTAARHEPIPFCCERKEVGGSADWSFRQLSEH